MVFWAVRLLWQDGQMKCQLDCSELGSCSSQKAGTRLSTNENFTHVLVIGEFPECPLGNFLILPFPLLLTPAYHYTQPGSPSWLKLSATSVQTEQHGSLQSSYPDGNGGAPSCWPGASTWHTAKCWVISCMSSKLKNALKQDLSATTTKRN